MRLPRLRLRSWMLVTCILVGYMASLGRALDHDLVWDDVPEIQNNPAFDRPLHEGLLLTQVERGAAELAGLETLQFTYDSYRPITFASYWIDIAVWGRSPRALHATSIVLGALAIVLVFLVVRRWVGPQLAWLPTAIFALHPVQIETVAYVSARGDLLAGVFALASTYAVLRSADAVSTKRAVAWAALGLLGFAASLLAKETYLGLPVALGVILWTRSSGAARWWVPAALLGVAIGYVPFRAAMIEVHESAPLRDAIIGFPAFIVEALRIVLLPFDLSIERRAHTNALIGWGVVAATAIVVGWSWRRARAAGSSGSTCPRVLAGLGWFVLLLGPSAIVVERTGIAADRYLYLPLLGAAVAITVAIDAFLKADRLRPAIRRAGIAAAMVWATIVLAVAWVQVPVWHDRSSLYRHALAMAPGSSGAHYRVALLEIQAGRWEVAAGLLERAIELDAQNARALNDLGVYYLRSGRADDAERTLGQSVAANAGHFRAWTNLGLAQLANGKLEAGCNSLARATFINPNYTPAHRARSQSCEP